MPQDIQTVGVLGAGTIGPSWTALFLASGYIVQVYDCTKFVQESIPERIFDFARASEGLHRQPGRIQLALAFCSVRKLSTNFRTMGI